MHTKNIFSSMRLFIQTSTVNSNTCMKSASKKARSHMANVLMMVLLSLLLTQTAQAAIAFESSVTATQPNKAINSITFASAPLGTVQGDLLLASIGTKKTDKDNDPSTSGITAPVGWTMIEQGDIEDHTALAVFYKIAGATEAGPYVFTVTSLDGNGDPEDDANFEEIAGAILRYSGVDTTTPIDVSGGQSSDAGTGIDKSTPTSPAVTTTYANTMVVRAFAQKDGKTLDVVPSGTTERAEVNENDKVLLGVADSLQASTGSTGTGVFTTSESKEWYAATVVLVPIQVKLEIDKDTTTPTVSAGGQANYTILVENISANNIDANNVVISDTLPAGFTYASGTVTPSGAATCTGTPTPSVGDTSLSWGTCTIPQGETVTVDFTVDVPANTTAATYDNTASVTSTETGSIDDDGTVAQDTDTPTGNDPEDDEDVTVLDADLAITKTVDNATPNEGENVVYTIVATNNGTGDATGVGVKDILSSNLTLVSATATQGSCSVNPTISCALGSIANGNSVTITITATVNGDLGDATVTSNTAGIGGDQNDPDSTNNSSNVDITTCPANNLLNIASVSSSTADSVPSNNTDSVCTEVVPFVSISGNVFNDANGLTDFIVNGTGIGSLGGAPLYATLVDTLGNVVASLAVDGSGSYSFPSVTANTSYSVQISTTNESGNIGNAAAAPVLPNGWINTGENIGTGAGNDGSVNGSISVTVTTSNVEDVNFGIEQTPTANDVTALSQSNPGGTAQVTVPTLNGTDPEDITIGSGDTMVIKTLPSNGTLYYDGSPVSANDTITNYDPSKLTVDPNDGIASVVFTYSVVDAAGEESIPATVTMPFVDNALDYGDLPDTTSGTDTDDYQTTLLNDGARHSTLDPTIYLGTIAPDAEVDGQSSAEADGDGAEEDGISFHNPMVEGTDLNLTVSASSGCNTEICYLFIWIDFNQDGDFNDPGEKITADALTVSAGDTNLLYTVPTITDPNNPVYVMARLTTDADIGPTGYASDGEVETFKITAPSLLPVTISYVYPQMYGNSLEVAFATATELGNIGFNIYAIKGKKWTKLNEELIPGAMDSFGPKEYQTHISVPETLKIKRIGIAGVDVNGKEDRHGPFKIGHESGEKAVAVRINWKKVKAQVKADKKAKKAARKAKRAAKKAAKKETRTLLKDEIVNLSVDKNAVYRITHEELLAAGIDLKGFKSKKIAISFKGEGVARYIDGVDKKGRWSEDSWLEFKGTVLTSKDALYIKANLYQLSLNKRLAVASEMIAPMTAKELVFEVNKQYGNAVPGDDPFYDGFFYARGTSDGSVSSTFNLSAVSEGEYALTMYLSALSDVPHHLTVALNGTEVADIRNEGSIVIPVEITADKNILNEGINTLTFTAVGEGELFDIYTYDKTVLRYDDGEEVASSKAPISVGEKISKKEIAPQNGKNYLIISHPLFIGEMMEHYVSQKSSQGWNIQLVNVEDIYAVYGYGMDTPDAITAYLKEAQSAGVTHVQLVGAASYDYHDYLGLGSVSFIPSIYVSTGGIAHWTPSDTLYVADETGLPQLAIGRWPVRTLEELEAVVNKSLNWNASGQDTAHTALFIADKYDGRNPFALQMESVAQQFESKWAQSDITRVYLDEYIQENNDNMSAAVTAAREAIAQSLNEGASILSYSGHSAPTTWSYDGLLRQSDIASIQNEATPTLALPLACYTAYADSPSVDTMAHQLVAAGENGAVAVYGATLFSSYSENGMITSRVIDHLFAGDTLGEAVRKSKNELGTAYINTIINGSLLGDVTLRVK